MIRVCCAVGAGRAGAVGRVGRPEQNAYSLMSFLPYYYVEQDLCGFHVIPLPGDHNVSIFKEDMMRNALPWLRLHLTFQRLGCAP